MQLEIYSDYFSTKKKKVHAGGGMLAVQRDLFLSAGGFDETMTHAEDHDFILRFGDGHGFAIIVHPTLVLHRMHSQERLTDHLPAVLSGVRRLVEKGAMRQLSWQGGKSFR